jgi:REP element-mobilizing transposase RayT
VEHSKPLFSFYSVIRAFLFSDTLLEYEKHKRNIGKVLWGEKMLSSEGYFAFTIRKVSKEAAEY